MLFASPRSTVVEAQRLRFHLFSSCVFLYHGVVLLLSATACGDACDHQTSMRSGVWRLVFLDLVFFKIYAFPHFDTEQ